MPGSGAGRGLPLPRAFATVTRGLSGPHGAFALPSLGVQPRPDPRAHSVARFYCISCSFLSIGEQQSFTLGWEGYSLTQGGPQPSCPAPPRPGPHSSAPGFHGEAGRAGGHGRKGPCQTQLSQSIPSRHPRPRKVWGLFLSILTPALVPTPASRAAEAKDACFWGQAKMGPLPMRWALWKGLGHSLWSTQPRLADRCMVPRIDGERPLTPLCKSGSD